VANGLGSRVYSWGGKINVCLCRGRGRPRTLQGCRQGSPSKAFHAVAAIEVDAGSCPWGVVRVVIGVGVVNVPRAFRLG